MASSDTNDGGRGDSRVCFECASDRCDWFAVVRNLTCQRGGVVDGGVVFLDFMPHKLARGEGGVGLGRVKLG